MADRNPFVLGDRAVAALAACVALGALAGGGPGLVAGAVVLAVGLVVHRPTLVCLAMAIVAACLADRAMAGLDPVSPGPVSGWATLVSDPEPLDAGGIRVVVRLDGRRLEATAFGREAGLLADRLAGERIEVRGSLRPPPEDAPWLVARRVVGRLAIDEVGGTAPGSPITRLANGLRRTMAEGAVGLPRAARSLLAGVVLGDEREQPPEVTDDFRAAGLTHLLAVSGQNVAFVLAVAGPILTRLRWRARLPATLGVLAFFALLVRFEPSVLRAAAMASVATTAAALGRPAAGIRTLALAVTALVLVDPLLVRSVGFGLSVCASGAILLLGPRVQSVLGGPRWLAEPLSVTLAAQVGTLPLLVVTFGGLPVAAVPANLLAVPAAGPLMVWGLTGGLFAGVAPGWLVGVLQVPTAVLAWWLAAVARWSAALPLGELGTGEAMCMALSFGLFVGLRRYGVAWARPALGAGMATVLLLAALGRPTFGEGRRDIGDTATVLSSAGGTVLLIDGAVGAERMLEQLRRSGTRCIDVIAVDGGGRSAAVVAAALQRRCTRTIVVAPAGRAHPGWVALAPGEQVTAGDLVVAATSGPSLAVQRATRPAEPSAGDG